jgi:hypothetical protein
VACEVTSFSNEAFSCQVAEATAASTAGVPNIGQHGVIKEVIDSSRDPNSDFVSFENFEDLTKTDWTRTKSLAMQLEAFN